MAQMFTVRLSRGDNSPWGFRLQGGKDFGTPLVIQKVNGGSPAEKAGLIAGDSVVKVNSTDVFNLRHKDAQDVIVRAGQSFELTVQRGGSTWKPSVTPVGTLPRTQSTVNNVSPVTKTSLAAKKQEFTPIGAAHNMSAKGFNAAPHMNGDGPKLVNKQYNSPMPLYSEQSIAETLSAQAEVLQTGAIGVNFKKNEKNYNSSQSEVFKMLQEVEKEPKTPEPVVVPETVVNSGVVSSPVPSGIAGLRHVTAPETRPAPAAPTTPAAGANQQLPPGQNICADCERLIVGVFVRIKDKNLHVECFKCATCGTSLKNVGYYNINQKLYCDIHAKLAARSNPPAPNMVPITVAPGAKVPAGTISAALASHSLPSPSPLSPSGNQMAAPFQQSQIQDTVDRFSPCKAPTIRKEDAVANLMSALNLVSQKQYKENGTNTEPVFLSEKVIPINNNFNNGDSNIVKDQQYASVPVKFMQYKPQTGASLSGPKPFSSVTPSTPTLAPVVPPLSNTLPRSASSTAMPERKEWPPSKSEELPTASPLYIDPASRGPTPHPPPQVFTNPQPAIPPSPPVFIPNETNYSKPQVQEFGSESKYSYEISNVSQRAFDHKMSICSAEVTNITGRKSAMECVETISDSIETQKLVNAITKERPKSPPPIHRKDSVLDTQNIHVVVTTNPDKDGKPDIPVVKVNDSSNTVNIENFTVCRTNACNSNVCQNPGPNQPPTCPRNNPNPGPKTGQTVSIPKPPQMCPMSNPGSKETQSNPGPKPAQICPMNNPECNIQPATCPQMVQQCPLNAPFITRICETSSSSNLINTVPKEYISPMVKALTVASDRPFNAVSLTIESKEYDRGSSKTTSGMSVETQTVQETVKTEGKFPHVQAPPSVTPMAKAMTIAPSKPFTPTPQITMEPVPLPAESAPYIPPEIPITVEPKVPKQVETCKSPFVQALTTAPDRPYTPMVGHDNSDVPDFMKDVPPPPKQRMTMLSALTTASERPFTPALSIGDGQEVQMEPVPTQPPKPVRKNVEMAPIPAKPASHLSPSAFRPIASSSKPFKPVSQTYNPQQETLPKPLTSFPPVSDELKSSFSPAGTGFSYSTPSKIVGMQDSGVQAQIKQQQQQLVQEQHQVQQQHLQRQQHQVQEQHMQQQHQVQEHHMQQKQQVQQHHMQQQQQHQLHMQQQLHMEQQQRIEQQKHVQHLQHQQQISSRQEIPQVMISEKDEYNKQQNIKQLMSTKVGSGLHAASSIPGYQMNLNQRSIDDQYMMQLPQPPQPIQKPVTTLKPGQYQANNHTTFQPVNDGNNHGHYLRTSSPLPRSLSPSMINHPAPSIPYYQADLVAHECAPVETCLFDPRSPAISRSPSPMPGRSTSPFPRTMTKSPAQGPPPNPLGDRVPKPTVKDNRLIEAKQNLTSYIPKYQGRVEQIKKVLTVDHGGQSKTVSGQSQMITGQSQLLVSGQSQIAKQSESYQNVQIAQRANQQQNQMYKMSEVENLKHMEQLNKSQIQSVETSADNMVQIQRTRKFTEEFERTQKSKVIEIQRTGGGVVQTSQNVASIGGSSFGQGFQNQITQAQTSAFQAPQVGPSRIPQKPTPPSVPSQAPRSYSLPGSTSSLPKPFKPSPLASAPSRAPTVGQSASRPNVSQSSAGTTTGRQTGAIGVSPKRGRGILNLASAPGSRVPLCGHCNSHIRGPFITALGKIWCPEHFVCNTPTCKRPLQDMGFVEERGALYCEYCFEQYLAPVCSKCNSKIKGDCLNAIGKHFHPECFTCAYCSKLFGNSPFFLEDGLPYCEADWNELFTTKCFACGFPVEAGDRWVEALNNNYHSQCFNCTMCKKNLEGQSFFAKGGRPFCKNHAR